MSLLDFIHGVKPNSMNTPTSKTKELPNDGSEIRIAPVCDLDMDSVLEIEHASHRYPWEARDFHNVRRNDLCRMYVASKIMPLSQNVLGFPVHERSVVGFVVAEFRPDRKVKLENVAVRDDYRRRGIGELLVGRIQSQLEPEHLRIECLVRERNLAAQLFFRKCGFVASHSIYRPYERDKCDEDGIEFHFKNPGAVHGVSR